MGIEFSERVGFDAPGRLFVDTRGQNTKIWVELVLFGVDQPDATKPITMQWNLPDGMSVAPTKQRIPRKLDRGFPPEAVGQSGFIESNSTWVEATPLAENRWSFIAPRRAPAARLAFVIEQPLADTVLLPTAASTLSNDDVSARWAIYCRPPPGQKPYFVAPEETDRPLHPHFEANARPAGRFAWGGAFAHIASSVEQPIFRAVTQNVPDTFDRTLGWRL